MKSWPRRLSETDIETTHPLDVEINGESELKSTTYSAPETSARHLSRFRADWEGLEAKLVSNGSQPDRLLALRRSAWSEFERIGFPIHRRGNELWKYTDLQPVDRQEFVHGSSSATVDAETLPKHAPMSDSWLNLVFVDGVFSPGLSDEAESVAGVGLHSLNHAGAIGGCRPLESVGELAEFRGDAFVSLNTAFMADGLLVAIDPGSRIEGPINVIFVTTVQGDEPRASYPRVCLTAGEGSSATLIESHVSTANSVYLTAPVVEIFLARDSKLNHYRAQLDGEDSYHFSTTRVSQDDGSAYLSIAFALGPAIGRNDLHTILEGEDVESTLHGLYVTNNRQHQLNEVSVSHNRPHGTSQQYYKGILAGRSQAVFSGKITVARGAQKTAAQQKDLNLMLSHGAEVDTKPSLEIYADDVQCAHGATAGHINEDTLFYLQSRGIDYDTAQAMLIRGFAAEILDEFDEPDLHEFLSRIIDRLIPQLQASSDTIGTA